jgi:probable F420-dependent oxidoreductase
LSLPKLGVALGKAHPSFHLEITLAAEKLGFESVWMPEHLIFPLAMAGSPYPGQAHPPVPPTTPVFDAFGWLCFLAGKTERIRLGTNVYLLGLRHPFVAARAVQTLDVVSNGRAELGVGAGWLREEWVAAGLDPGTRGRRLDEALGVVKRLWSEPVVEHHGEFYDFGPVAFEPKPVQKPWPKIHVGGESDAALRRAARHGDGWLGVWCSASRYAKALERIDEEAAAAGRAGRRWQHGLQVWVGVDDDAARARARLAHAMESMYRIPFERFERTSPYGDPECIADFLAPYVEAGCTSFNVMPVAPSSERAIDALALVKERLA